MVRKEPKMKNCVYVWNARNLAFQGKVLFIKTLMLSVIGFEVEFKGISEKQNRSTEGCSKLKRSVDMTSSGKNGLNIRTNASPKWDRTRCPEE